MTADITPRPALARFWQGLVIRPIRDGRIRDTGWPVGLAPVVALSIAAFVLAVAMILGGPLIRAGFSISASVGSTVLSLPNVALPIVLWLVVVSLSLMQGAALHVRGGLSAVLTAMSVLVVLFIGAIDLGPDGEGGVTLTPGKAVSVIASVAIVAITLARRRRTFTWWEFPVLIAVIGASIVVSIGGSAAQSAVFGIDFVPTAVAIIMSSIGQLAVPAALAAGVVVAQVAVTASRSAVAVAGGRGRVTSSGVPLTLLVLLGVVAFWRLADVAVPALMNGEVDPELLSALPGSMLLLLFVGAFWWALQAVRRTRGPGADAVEAGLDSVAVPVAIGLTITIAPIVVLLLTVQVAASWGLPAGIQTIALQVAAVLSSTVVVALTRSLVGAILLVVAVVMARRGSRGAPEVLMAIGLIALASTIPDLVGLTAPWSSDALALIIAVATVTLLVVWAVRRELDERRAALLATALVLSAAMAWREVIADPLSIVIGSSGVALVLFGFVWGFVTDAGATHDDSAAYPRPARVLLFLANAVFGVTVLSFGVLARDLDVPINLDDFAQFGDQLLGTALIICAVVALWAAALPRVSVDSLPMSRSVST